MSHDLLTPERLFEQLFLPLYPAGARAKSPPAPMARGGSPFAPSCAPAADGGASALRAIEDAAERFARLAPEAFDDRTLELDFSDASIRRLAGALTRPRRDRWAAERGPDGAPLLSHLVIHGAMYVGACAVRRHSASWRIANPLWESLVRVESPLGQADLSVFSWWLRALSDSEIGRGTLGERYRMYVEVPRTDPGRLSPIAPQPRVVPRLAKVRYDTLHRHLRAHVPELRDLGRDFPSAERLAEIGFRWLDFTWLGGGRLLLVHGPAKHGVHLFWLDASGFYKAAFFPADAVPEGDETLEAEPLRGSAYSLDHDGELVRIELSVGGRRVEHTMLFWGP